VGEAGTQRSYLLEGAMVNGFRRIFLILALRQSLARGAGGGLQDCEYCWQKKQSPGDGESVFLGLLVEGLLASGTAEVDLTPIVR
jgi:hypothetical protein